MSKCCCWLSYGIWYCVGRTAYYGITGWIRTKGRAAVDYLLAIHVSAVDVLWNVLAVVAVQALVPVHFVGVGGADLAGHVRRIRNANRYTTVPQKSYNTNIARYDTEKYFFLLRFLSRTNFNLRWNWRSCSTMNSKRYVGMLGRVMFGHRNGVFRVASDRFQQDGHPYTPLTRSWNILDQNKWSSHFEAKWDYYWVFGVFLTSFQSRSYPLRLLVVVKPQEGSFYR